MSGTVPAPAQDQTLVTAEDQKRLRDYWLQFNPNHGMIMPMTLWDDGATVWDDGATNWPT
jgi:hypothetical protein